MEVFADLGFRRNFQISLWKTAFGGISSLETNFGGIDNWNFAPVKSEKMSAELAEISAELPAISAELPAISAELPGLSFWKSYFGRIEDCRRFFLFSADFFEFGDSCAEM